MGLQIGAVPASVAARLGLKNSAGAYVVTLIKDGPAVNAGLQQGDIVVSLNEMPVTDPWNFSYAIHKFAPGTVIRLGFIRDGAPHTAPLALDTWPTLGKKPQPHDNPLASVPLADQGMLAINNVFSQVYVSLGVSQQYATAINDTVNPKQGVLYAQSTAGWLIQEVADPCTYSMSPMTILHMILPDGGFAVPPNTRLKPSGGPVATISFSRLTGHYAASQTSVVDGSLTVYGRGPAVCDRDKWTRTMRCHSNLAMTGPVFQIAWVLKSLHFIAAHGCKPTEIESDSPM